MTSATIKVLLSHLLAEIIAQIPSNYNTYTKKLRIPLRFAFYYL